MRTKGWRMPANTKYVGRRTKWGNPYRVMWFVEGPAEWNVPNGGWKVVSQDGTLMSYNALKLPAIYTSIRLYRRYIEKIETDRKRAMLPSFLEPLKGKNLACWCPLDQPCHADILLDMANKVSFCELCRNGLHLYCTNPWNQYKWSNGTMKTVCCDGIESYEDFENWDK